MTPRSSEADDPSAVSEWRDILYLSAIRTWQALASGQSAPDLDMDLEQAIYKAFVTSDGCYRSTSSARAGWT